LLIDHTLVHRALRRAEEVDLYSGATRAAHLPNFEELLVHAGRFLAPAHLGELASGIPAAWAAKPMAALIRESPGDLSPVWPSATGRVRGQALPPVHPAATKAIETSPQLAELLSVIDSLRAGDARVRQVAAEFLHDTLRRQARSRAGVA
jgi:hypothetical protein